MKLNDVRGALFRPTIFSAFQLQEDLQQQQQ